MKRAAIVLTLGIVLTGCGGGGGSPEDAVKTYSEAFLSGDGATAYALLSQRCQDRITMTEFESVTSAAQDTYGQVDMSSFSVDEQSGDLARVTYTYPVSALDQQGEPWVRESGEWRQDDC